MPSIRDKSQNGLRDDSHDYIDRLHDEYERRMEEARKYFRLVCSFDKCLELWYILCVSGGFRSFTEITVVARSIGIKSDTTLSKNLRKLRANKLAVVRSDGLYQMLGPSLLLNS